METITKMTWTRVDKYHIESECGRYRITKRGDPAKYLSWHRDKKWEIIGEVSTKIEEAKRICAQLYLT